MNTDLDLDLEHAQEKTTIMRLESALTFTLWFTGWRKEGRGGRQLWFVQEVFARGHRDVVLRVRQEHPAVVVLPLVVRVRHKLFLEGWAARGQQTDAGTCARTCR